MDPAQCWRRNQRAQDIRLDCRGDTSLREPGKGHWLLARRSIANPGELAYYVCFGPAETALEELVRVAGTRWA